MNTQTSFDKLPPELQAQVMRKKLVDAISAVYLPSDDKPTWAPFELCEEMLEGVDLKGEILVLSDLGFIPVLKKRGVDLTRVTLVVHTDAQEKLARALMSVNRISVGQIWNVGYNSCINELESRLVGLKFDIVVGNPPYQSADDRRDGAIWPEFLNIAVSTLKQTGICAFITPDTWTADDTGKVHSDGATITVSGTRKTIFDRHHVKRVRVGASLQKRFFPSVAVNFSYYILQAGMRGDTELITDDGIVHVDLNELPFIPVRCNELILSILKKTLFSDVEKFKVLNGSYRYRVKNGAHTRATKDHVFKYPFVTTSAKYTKKQYGYTSEPILGVGESKVIWSNSGYNSPFYDSGEFGLGDHSSAIVVSPETGASVLWLLTESKLIKFLANLKSVGGYVLGISTIKNYLPKFDGRITCDADLYRHFNFTNEEIMLIERA